MALYRIGKALGRLFLGLIPLTPAAEHLRQIAQHPIAREPTVPLPQRPVIGRIGPGQVRAVCNAQSRCELLERFAQLLVIQRKGQRRGERFPLRRPSIEHPQDQFRKVLHAQRRDPVLRLFLKVDRAGLHLFEHPRKSRVPAGALRPIQIGQMQHLDLKFACLRIVAAERFRSPRHHSFSSLRR